MSATYRGVRYEVKPKVASHAELNLRYRAVKHTHSR